MKNFYYSPRLILGNFNEILGSNDPEKYSFGQTEWKENYQIPAFIVCNEWVKEIDPVTLKEKIKVPKTCRQKATQFSDEMQLSVFDPRIGKVRFLDNLAYNLFKFGYTSLGHIT